MKLRTLSFQSAVLALGLLSASVASAQTAQALQMRTLAASCASCHGTDGKAVQGAAMPALAGLPKEFIVAQMRAFRDGQRPATVMHQIAKGYTEAQIDSISTYFSSRK